MAGEVAWGVVKSRCPHQAVHAHGRGDKALVHRWYEPDSYDSCMPAAVAPEALEPDKRIRGARRPLPAWPGQGGTTKQPGSTCHCATAWSSMYKLCLPCCDRCFPAVG